ncbi:UDP-N-acetylglucosamine transferase subunit ALG14 -like [Scophthalmus maximus]|uniref:UDP-N-acetylglucosamine transferase subunit ALG14 n=1 Tax=Scophthalmus maximus TaxID=52904 RepID=A0A2U9CY81_SCOMX|nr:UDP-N-acetylglucosamine transferase subunit ALG14 homolog [Scophthalmus maximus]AWP21010.1 UDP-N-acetylglucosamine transferase subunit ALG14 -like [Scophthalmus maximus]
MFPEAAAFVIIFTCLFFIARLYIVVKNRPKHKAGAKGRVAVLVVAGSGGHTTEILRLTECLSAAYAPRHYVIADTDQMSEEKICTFERSRQRSDSETQFTICRIPRSREVHQSWTSSVVSTLKALQYSVPLVFRLRPDVVLCNGPGTCVPLCAAGLLLGILGMKKVLIVYVESICRVHTLSLTGRILYLISDYFFVQWSSLRDKYPKSIFLGRIV